MKDLIKRAREFGYTLIKKHELIESLLEEGVDSSLNYVNPYLSDQV